MTENLFPVITQSNALIRSSYHYTLYEKRIFLFVLSKISPKDSTLRPIKIPLDEFCDSFQIKNQPGVLEKIYEASQRLLHREVHILEDDRRIVRTFATGFIENFNKPYAEIEINQKLIPHLLELKSFFTTYKLYNVLNLRSFNTIRIYELLKSFEYKKTLTITLEDLKETLSLQDHYPVYANFRIRVLAPAVKDINATTDLNISFKQIRKIRKIHSVQFTIKKSKKQQFILPLVLDDANFQSTRDKLTDLFRFKIKEVDEILKKHRENPEFLESNIDYTLDRITTIENPRAFLISALDKDYAAKSREDKTRSDVVDEARLEIAAIKKKIEDADSSYGHYFDEKILERFESQEPDKRTADATSFFNQDNIFIQRIKKTDPDLELKRNKYMFLQFFLKTLQDFEQPSKEEFFRDRGFNFLKDAERIKSLEKIVTKSAAMISSARHLLED